MTISGLTPRRSKSLAAKLTIAADKIKGFQDQQKKRFLSDESAIKAKEAELRQAGLEGADLDFAVQQFRLEEVEETGFEVVKEIFRLFFEEEYDFAISIVADLFNVTLDEAQDIPFEDIFDLVLKDRIVRLFFPRLALLEARTQLDTLPK